MGSRKYLIICNTVYEVDDRGEKHVVLPVSTSEDVLKITVGNDHMTVRVVRAASRGLVEQDVVLWFEEIVVEPCPCIEDLEDPEW